MADSTKKISMELSVSTVNTESINRLRDDVKELAKQGGAAAPEFKELADELSKFATQAAQLEQLEQLDAALKEAAAGAAELTAKTRDLRSEVDAQAAQAKAASDAEQANTAAIKAKALDIKLLENAVKQLRLAESSGANATAENAQAIQQTLAVLSKVTGETREYSAALDTNKTVIRDARQAVAELQAQKLQLQANGVALKELADQESAALKELSATYRVANTESERASRAARALSDEVGAVRDGARSAGLAVDDLGEAQRQLAAQVVDAAGALKQLVQQQNALADTAAIEQAYKRTLDGLNAQIKLSQQEAALRQKHAAEAIALARKQSDEEAKAAADAEKAVRDATTAAANAMRDAFGSIGAKSAAALRAEIEQVRASMQMLASSGMLTGKELDVAMRSGNAAIKALERDLREATGTLTLMDRAGSALKTTMGQLAAFFSITTAVESTGRAFYEATKQIQSLELGLEAVYGDADIARKQIDFLREAANSGGIAVKDISGSFTKFSVATKEANIPIEQSNELFKELTRVSGLMGLSSASVDRALNALAQTSSKGVVQLEELSGQLGDALPGALSLVAKGLGVTTGELMKMVEAGTLTHKQLIPALTIGLKSLEGQNDTLAGSVGRVSNAITEFYQQASDSTAMRSVTDGLNALAANFGTVVDVVAALGKGMLALKFVEYVRGIELFGGASRKAATDVEAQTAATAANTAALNANTAAKSANAAATATALVGAATTTKAAGDAAASAAAQKTLFATAMGATGTAARGLMGVMGGPLGLITLTAVYAKDIGELAAKLVLKAKGMKTAEESANEMAKADAQAKAKAEELAAAQAAATLALEMKVAKEIGALKEARVAADAKTAADEKGTLAAVEQGKTLEKLASIRGDEVSKLDAATAASGLQYAAAAREAESKIALVAAIEAELAKRKEAIAASGVESKELKKQQDELAQLLAKKKEEAAASVAIRDTLRLEVAERSTASTAYRDNSNRVEELRSAMVNAKAAVEALSAMQAEGLPVAGAMSKAQIELAQATALYADATNDAMRMQDIAAQTQQADIQLKMAAQEAAKAQGEATIALGQSVGDQATVVRGTLAVKEAELQLTRLQQEATVAQAQARLDAANFALQAEIDKTDGQLNPVKRAELELSIRQAEAALALARAKGVNTSALEQEIAALRRGTSEKDANRNASGNTSNAISAETEVRFKNAEAIQEENDRLAAQNNLRKMGASYYDKDGWVTDASGNRITATTGGMTDSKGVYWSPEALAAKKQRDDAEAERQKAERDSQRDARISEGVASYSDFMDKAYSEFGLWGGQGAEWVNAKLEEQAAKRNTSRETTATQSSLNNQIGSSLSSAAGTSVQAPTPVIINLNGASTQVNVASAADATALQTLLQQLANGQSRSI